MGCWSLCVKVEEIQGEKLKERDGAGSGSET